jgi:hypothetical protein
VGKWLRADQPQLGKGKTAHGSAFCAGNKFDFAIIDQGNFALQ